MKSKKKLRVILVTICMIILVTTIIFINYMGRVNRYREMVNNIDYEDIDISIIPDGTYIGECNAEFIYAKVEVTVEEGRITDIKILEHKNDRGSAAEKITNEIIDKQMIDVDAISGATNSSKVIKKAVENALLG
ncbi:MAG: FMN-binding protein [Herbinix sp.]|jgi:uncharacterized protein with FMN-binding domain|nr:FMN-binding protein [Herbinix sp.]